MSVPPANHLLFADLDVEALPDHPIGKDTWYAVGGRADMLLRPRTTEALSRIVRRCHESDVPVRILGSGANLLVADEGVGGIVVSLDHPHFKEVSYNLDGAPELIRAMAGADMQKTMHETVRRGLGGLEQMAGIPASIGGALTMNAGGAFGEIADSLHAVACLDRRGEIVIYPRESLEMGYRTTNLPDAPILWGTFKLMDRDPLLLRERVKEIFQYKRKSQPMADKSAGCAFRNPIDPQTGERISAGMLIDRANLKGRCVGEAEVSQCHGNFLVMKTGAGKASDLVRLIDVVKQAVHADSGIELETEVVIWDRD
ncbi:MAG: UDP-N-acetylenolpyruvoylglucosamine reductase [Phycisphaerae bacterium]|nr:UDP-N-acetylenolpyruvoylglucosamine reductase [Phycisphaerae bacterium]